MSDASAVKLTKAQGELLALLGSGPRSGIVDKRTANALGLQALVEFDAPTDTWTITERGRALLDALKEDGESRDRLGER